MSPPQEAQRAGLAGRLAAAFISSKLTPLIVAAALGVGLLSLLAMPAEEEPQIRVPIVDVTVQWPGAEPAEIAARIVEPLERSLYGIPGIEHVYSQARPGVALVTARFHVNEPYPASLVKVFERQAALNHLLPPGASQPIVELRTIDDVPFLTLTLWAAGSSSDDLRPLAAELAQELAEIPDVARPMLIGGQPRVVRVEPDLDRLNAAGVGWSELAAALRRASLSLPAASAVRDNSEIRLRAQSLFQNADEVRRTVVAIHDGRPIYVEDVAHVIDGPDEATHAVFFSSGPARDRGHPALPPGSEQAAVTLALAKRPGADAPRLAAAVLDKVEQLRPRLLPAAVAIEVTRNYGRTAADKARELGRHLMLASFAVVVLISLAMGWRSGLIVAIAVPVTLALTLFIYRLAGYTLNRVTLFALIFAIGILVDDAIVVVENIERRYREWRERPAGREDISLAGVAIMAVDEVGNPTILATLAVIAAILPMAFVGGLMGPYMRPIPVGASAAMLCSLAVAFIVAPWAALRVFRHRDAAIGSASKPESVTARTYRRVMTALLQRRGVRRGFFAAVAVAFVAALGMVGTGLVKVKMLPFDDKSELQVLIDHEVGTPLEVTLQTAREMNRYLATIAAVADVQIYAGIAAPLNFNGLVRQYFLRRAPELADLQVNLAAKHRRPDQSHAIAQRLRPVLTEIARRRGARVKIVEIPPGPPVLDTLVAEIYGPTPAAREALAATVRGFFETTPGIVDVDDSLAAAHRQSTIEVDRERAGLKAIAPATVVEAIAEPAAGRDVARIEAPAAREPVPVRVRLSQADRADLARRLSLRVESPLGGAPALAELVDVHRAPEPQPILHKDLKPLVYVFGDLAGERESPVYALAGLNEKIDALALPDGTGVERYAVRAPSTSERPALKWDGEWQITYEVFRDLGIAFAIVLALIAALVIGWFRSWRAPLVILLPIPLSLIGILPGHWALGAFFTATSMIGFIAGAGILVRNSILLVDAIELRLGEGMALEQAVIEAGVVRFRPMLLTAAAVIAGSSVMLFDPIFQGLALSLMAGEVAAVLLSRLAVPVVYYRLAQRRTARRVSQ